MQVAKWGICLSAFVTKICLAALIIEDAKLDEFLVDASIDVLESCYADRFGTVVLAGPSAGSIFKRISLRDTVISATLIDETSRAVSHAPIPRTSRHKLQVFVVTVTDPRTLADTIVQVKNSKWWNHMASFLLIDSPMIGNECSNAHEILWEAWKMNLLNSKLMCRHPVRGTLIYTFNPYTSEAPVPWQQENTYEGMDGHVWTLFVRQYRDNESRCDALDFDKTSNLGGYKIRASVQGMENWWYANSSMKPSLINRVKNFTAQLLMESLDATWMLQLYPDNGMTDLPDVEADVESGRSDITLNPYTLTSFLNENDTTYRHTDFSVEVITQYRGHKSQLDKIISVLDRSSRFGVVVVLLITLSFFKFYLRQPTIAAVLNLVRITCNSAIRKIPNKPAPRIYLAGLLTFVVTIQGIYQGQLATLLTSDVSLENINSVEDLVRSNHTIYSAVPYQYLFAQSAFEGRYVALNELNCTGYVLRDSNAACAGPRIRLIGEAAKFKLHLSDKPIGILRSVFVIRKDWPLEERVNAVYQRAMDSGVMDFLETRALTSEIRTLESYENEYQEHARKMLTLGHLGFAFVILLIGLGCATIVFVIEVATFPT